MAYTYEDFERALNAAGMNNRFSQYDLELAQKYPSAGMGLLSAKRDYYNTAMDDAGAAARAAANNRAEEIRRQYGNYIGGADGTQYNPYQTPSSFSPGAAPEYKNNYADELADIYKNVKNYGEYSYSAPQPTYNNRYGGQIDAILGGIINRAPFSYDQNTDPSYEAYKKEYTREGQRATADALGAASAATGGRPSSYAVTAAGQAGDYYASKLSDKIPELYNQAYNRYLQEYQNKLSSLSAVQGVEQNDYAKYLDNLSQYNTNRGFDYGIYSDGYNRLLSQLDAGRALESDDYGKYRDNLSQYNADRSFDYGQLLDDLNYKQGNDQTAYNRGRDALSDTQSAYQRDRALAEIAAQYGDYSGLRALGLDTSAYENNLASARQNDEYNRQLELAMNAAKYGDYSQLNALGINTSRIENEGGGNSDTYKRQLELAKLAAQYGDYSGLKALGINVSGSSGSSGAGYYPAYVDPVEGGYKLTKSPDSDNLYVLTTQRGRFPLDSAQVSEVRNAYDRNNKGKATDADKTILKRYFTDNELGTSSGGIENIIARFNAGDYSDEVVNALLAYGYTMDDINKAKNGG